MAGCKFESLSKKKLDRLTGGLPPLPPPRGKSKSLGLTGGPERPDPFATPTEIFRVLKRVLKKRPEKILQILSCLT